MERERGFLDAIAKHQNIKVVSDNQYGGATTESAMPRPSKFSAGFARVRIKRISKSMAFSVPMNRRHSACCCALQGGGFTKKVKFVGFDSSQKLMEALRAGAIHGLVLQNP
jgi:ribose transport system substrate-binding protein